MDDPSITAGICAAGPPSAERLGGLIAGVVRNKETECACDKAREPAIQMAASAPKHTPARAGHVSLQPLLLHPVGVWGGKLTTAENDFSS